MFLVSSSFNSFAHREGLAYFSGSLFESSGMNGHSKVQRLDPQTGKVIESQPLPLGGTYFGEGLTIVGSKLYVLTYKAKRGFIFDPKNISALPDEFEFDTTTGEGWGMTYDSSKHELIVSDGSNFLHFWDPDTIALKRKVQVKRQNSRNSKNINELEWWRGKVLANIWYEDILIVIDPETGIVEKEYGKCSCSTGRPLPALVQLKILFSQISTRYGRRTNEKNKAEGLKFLMESLFRKTPTFYMLQENIGIECS